MSVMNSICARITGNPFAGTTLHATPEVTPEVTPEDAPDAC